MSNFTEQKIKHLELVQAVITRMAGNSFLLKGWSVTLVSALFALASKEADVRYVLVSYFPAVMLWFLDGYFLFQERLFRNLYNQVRLAQSGETDFSMDTSGLDRGTATWLSALFSKTLLIFHGILIFTICVVMFFLSGK